MIPDRSTVDFEEAFHRHYEPLYRYLYRLTGDGDLAEDLAQEAFIRLLENPVGDGGVKAWLFTVGTNLVRDRSRVRGRREELLNQYDSQSTRPDRPDVELERRQRIAAVRAALHQLNERDREMLLLREEGFKYAEIAEVVGVAPSSVGTLLARALKRFEDAFDPATTTSEEAPEESRTRRPGGREERGGVEGADGSTPETS